MKRPILLLAFGIVGLIAAPLRADRLAEVWYVNAGGGPGKVHFSVTSPGSEDHLERAWFGWVWSESRIKGEWPSPYPADRSFGLISMMQMRQADMKNPNKVRNKSGKAAELRFPRVGVGPGKELWLLNDGTAEASLVKDWEELLDAVESAYRQVAPKETDSADPLDYREIGKLGECTIHSVPIQPTGTSASDGPWYSVTLPRAAPPQEADQYDGDLSAPSRIPVVHARRYLRWVDKDNCAPSSSKAGLQLFPIFDERDRPFLEVSQVGVQSLSWRDIAPAGWTPGSRQLAKLEPPNFVEPDGLETLPENLCSLPSVEPLCADDKTMRERLYLADPASNIPPERQDDLRVACEALLGQGKCPESAFNLQEGVYRRFFRGDFKLSDNSEIWSTLSEDVVSWRFNKDSSRERPIRLRRIGADNVVLEDRSGWPCWVWILFAVIAVIAMIVIAVVSVLLLIKRRNRKRRLAENKGKNREDHDTDSSQRPAGKLRSWWKRLFPGSPEGEGPNNGGNSQEPPAGGGPPKLDTGIESQVKTLVQSALTSLQKSMAEQKQALESQKQKVEELGRQIQDLSKGSRSIENRLTELRTSLKDDLRRELALDQKIEDARRQIRDAVANEKADFQKSVKLAEEDSKKVQRGALSRISDERDQILKTIGEEAKRRTAAELEKIQGDLMTRARDAIAASRKEVLSDFKAAAREEIAGVVDESWRPYASLVEKIEPWFQEERDRLDRVAEVLALFDRVPNLGAHLEILAERLPYEGFLSAVAPEHLDFSLASRQQTDEEGRKLYEKLNREIGSLESVSERESLDRSFAALGQLGFWIQALWGAMRVWGSFRDILEILPEPARQEWLSAFKLLRSFEVVDAVAFRRIARQRSGILGSAPVTRAEIDFLKSNGLLSGEKGLKDRLRLFLVPPGEPGHLGQVCLALQYLVEAFPIEQIRDRARCEEFSMRLRQAAETAGWPADFHSLIESAAAGAGLRYAAVPYYDSLVGDSRYRFIKQSIDVVDLVERTGRSLPSLDPKAVVRLICPFFFQEELFYAGRAGIARQ